MILTLLSIVGILYFTLQLENKFGIPSPLRLIGLSFLFHAFFHPTPLFTSNQAEFSLLVLFLLPVLLISDSLELRVNDLKENGLSLFYLSIIAVALSVFLAIFTADLIFAYYHLSCGHHYFVCHGARNNPRFGCQYFFKIFHCAPVKNFG